MTGYFIKRARCDLHCMKLFPDLNREQSEHIKKHVWDCPCDQWQKDAFIALENALIRAGWIE
jgi:hypothetical protein